MPDAANRQKRTEVLQTACWKKCEGESHLTRILLLEFDDGLDEQIDWWLSADLIEHFQVDGRQD